MTADNATGSGPLWLSIEGKIEELGAQDLTGGNLDLDATNCSYTSLSTTLSCDQ